MNNYKITLEGCGNQDLKEITVALPVKSALALAQWDLFELDCCGGPNIKVELVDESERTHHRDNYRYTTCGLDARMVLSSWTDPQVDCPVCIKALED